MQKSTYYDLAAHLILKFLEKPIICVLCFHRFIKKINHFIINLIKALFKSIKCNLSKLIKEMLNRKNSEWWYQ